MIIFLIETPINEVEMQWNDESENWLKYVTNMNDYFTF